MACEAEYDIDIEEVAEVVAEVIEANGALGSEEGRGDEVERMELYRGVEVAGVGEGLNTGIV